MIIKVEQARCPELTASLKGYVFFTSFTLLETEMFSLQNECVSVNIYLNFCQTFLAERRNALIYAKV